MTANSEIDFVTHRFLEAFNRKDAKACIECFSDKALLSRSEETNALGKECVQTALKSWFDSRPLPEFGNFSFVEVAMESELAYSLSAFEMSWDSDYSTQGKWLLVYGKQSEGIWKIDVASFVEEPIAGE